MGPTELNDLTAPNYDFNEYLQYGKTVRPSQKQCFVVKKLHVQIREIFITLLLSHCFANQKKKKKFKF